MKRYLSIFVVAIAVLGMTARAFCYQAEVIDISGKKYFPVVKEALKNTDNPKKSYAYVVGIIENK